MGIFSIDYHLEEIDNINEEEIKEKYCPDSEKSEQIKDFNILLRYLRDNTVFIKYMCYCDYEKARTLFIKIVNAFQIKIIDIDEKVNYIRLNGTERQIRISDWQFFTMPLICDAEAKQSLTCRMADFKYANNWGDETASVQRKIIHDMNGNVIWVKTDYRDPQHIIYLDNDYYAIENKHKHLIIYKNMKIKKGINVNNEYANLDDIVKEYDNDRYKCDEINIDLTEHFPKGFFYKGPKWTKELFPKGIIELREIKAVDGLVRIEIENISYPHKGRVLLDLKNPHIMVSGGHNGKKQ
jgi:hypothetical protein